MGAAHTYTQPHEAEQRRRLVRCVARLRCMHKKRAAMMAARLPLLLSLSILFGFSTAALLDSGMAARTCSRRTVIKVWQQRPIIIYGSWKDARLNLIQSARLIVQKSRWGNAGCCSPCTSYTLRELLFVVASADCRPRKFYTLAPQLHRIFWARQWK